MARVNILAAGLASVPVVALAMPCIALATAAGGNKGLVSLGGLQQGFADTTRHEKGWAQQITDRTEKKKYPTKVLHYLEG